MRILDFVMGAKVKSMRGELWFGDTLTAIAVDASDNTVRCSNENGQHLWFLARKLTMISSKNELHYLRYKQEPEKELPF